MTETVLGIIIGGVIALASSIITYVLTGYIKIVGKTYIFFRKFNIKDKRVLEGKIEIINTSNIIKIFRDIGIEYYLGNNLVKELPQANSAEIIPSKGEKTEVLYGDKGNYSVLLKAQTSIILHACFTDIDGENVDYDKIILRYYNQKNKVTRLLICDKKDINSINCKWIKLQKLRTRKPLIERAYKEN